MLTARRGILGPLLISIGLGGCGDGSHPQDLGPQVVSITTDTLPDGDQAIPYSAILGATGGSGRYSWRLVDGKLPAGLVLDGESGKISGTPTDARESTFTVEATDQLAQAAPGTKPLALTVHSVPEFGSPAPSGGVVGAAYRYELAATGGRGTYTWSVAAGGLPPGLSLDASGVIEGTPSAEGVWPFTIRLNSGTAFVDTDLDIAICGEGPTDDQWSGIDPWRGYQRNGAHTGHVPIELHPCRFAYAWTLDVGVGDREPSQIVTEGGVGIAVTYSSLSYLGGWVVAFNLATGVELWRLALDSPGHPGLAAGVVYVTSDRHRESEMVALDAVDGTLLFRTPFVNQSSRHRAPIVADGYVAAGGTLFGGVYVYDAASGESIWAAGLGSTPYNWHGPAVSASTVYMVSTSGPIALRSFDLSTGAALGSIGGTCNCVGGFTPMVATPDRAVAAVMWDLVGFDLESDSLAWVRTASTVRGQSVASGNGQVFSTADGAVEVVQAETGALVKQWEPPHGELGIWAPMLVTDNLLFLSFAGQIHAVDLVNWQEVWHYPVQGELSLSEGKLYIHSTDGRIIAVSVS